MAPGEVIIDIQGMNLSLSKQNKRKKRKRKKSINVTKQIIVKCKIRRHMQYYIVFKIVNMILISGFNENDLHN